MLRDNISNTNVPLDDSLPARGKKLPFHIAALIAVSLAIDAIKKAWNGTEDNDFIRDPEPMTRVLGSDSPPSQMKK